MNNLLSKFLVFLPAGLFIASAIIPNSCANTTQAPTGGPKDTIPPIIVNINPFPGTTNVPVHKPKFVFTFNEYVTVKNGSDIYLSPPLSKLPKYKIQGKSLVVYFDEDLIENTTYTLDIGNAVADNNEGNVYPGYTLVFSTGSKIDSMLVSGIVQDCNTLKPVKGATVMLYKDLRDSAVLKHRPAAAIKTDEWGFFCLRNIQDTVYHMYAIKDNEGNNIYDPDNDLIAFYDSLVKPTIKVNDTLPEVMRYSMKDTLHCLIRKTPYELNLFRGKPSKQMLKERVRTGIRSGYITFMAPNVQLDSVWIGGISSKRIMKQMNIERDSLEIWLNDQRQIPDTIKMFVTYRKTDSLGNLAPVTEQAKLFMENKNSYSRSSRRKLKHQDTICELKVSAEASRIEQYGVEMEFGLPLIKASFDSMELKYRTPRQKEFKSGFSVKKDSKNPRKYIVRPNSKLLQGYEYFLKIPQRKFKDINGFYNDSLLVKFSLPTDEKLSNLRLNIKNVKSNYIVDLLDERRKKVIRTYVISEDTSLEFPYLTAGKYMVRITEDKNGNGIVDTGSLLDHRQPEKVKFYKLKDKMFIDIPEKTELEQDVDIVEMFKN